MLALQIVALFLNIAAGGVLIWASLRMRRDLKTLSEQAAKLATVSQQLAQHLTEFQASLAEMHAATRHLRAVFGHNETPAKTVYH